MKHNLFLSLFAYWLLKFCFNGCRYNVRKSHVSCEIYYFSCPYWWDVTIHVYGNNEFQRLVLLRFCCLFGTAKIRVVTINCNMFIVMLKLIVKHKKLERFAYCCRMSLPIATVNSLFRTATVEHSLCFTVKTRSERLY